MTPGGPATAVREDADRLLFLRFLGDRVNHFILTCNGESAANYMTARQWIESAAPEDFTEVDPVELEHMKVLNRIWKLQIYTATPVGCYVYYGASLGRVIDLAMEEMRKW